MSWETVVFCSWWKATKYIHSSWIQMPMTSATADNQPISLRVMSSSIHWTASQRYKSGTTYLYPTLSTNFNNITTRWILNRFDLLNYRYQPDTISAVAGGPSVNNYMTGWLPWVWFIKENRSKSMQWQMHACMVSAFLHKNIISTFYHLFACYLMKQNVRNVSWIWY